MIRLVPLDEAHERRAYPLGFRNLLGRHPACSLQVLERAVAKYHCRIDRLGDGRYALEELPGVNDTRVNDVAVTHHVLRHGDALSLGPVRLRFEDTRRTEEARLEALESYVHHKVPAVELTWDERYTRDALRASHDLALLFDRDVARDAQCSNLADAVRILLGAGRCALVRPARTEHEARYRLWGITADEPYAYVPTLLSQPMVDTALSEAVALSTWDPSVEPKRVHTGPLRKCMYVPALCRGRARGVLYLSSLERQEPWTADDLGQALLLAETLASALEPLQ